MLDGYSISPEVEAAAHFWNAVRSGDEAALRHCIADQDLDLSKITYEEVISLTPQDFVKTAASIILKWLPNKPVFN